MQNVRINDNGAAFTICVDGLIVHVCSSLGDAWRHVKWMRDVASQKFTVGKTSVPADEWVRMMTKLGYLD